jgi:pyrroline-5-carboxylate reductase
MPNETKLAFIGSGTMAEAMIKVILDKNLIPPKQIIGSGPREERGQELRDRYGDES